MYSLRIGRLSDRNHPDWKRWHYGLFHYMLLELQFCDRKLEEGAQGQDPLT
jgi:hypothetical protein